VLLLLFSGVQGVIEILVNPIVQIGLLFMVTLAVAALYLESKGKTKLEYIVISMSVGGLFILVSAAIFILEGPTDNSILIYFIAGLAYLLFGAYKILKKS